MTKFITTDFYQFAIQLSHSLFFSLYNTLYMSLIFLCCFYSFTSNFVILQFYNVITGFMKVGGYQGVLEKYPVAVPNITHLSPAMKSCAYPPPNAFNLFRSADDGDLPWTGVTIGLTVLAVWYWCSDQERFCTVIDSTYDEISLTIIYMTD